MVCGIYSFCQQGIAPGSGGVHGDRYGCLGIHRVLRHAGIDDRLRRHRTRTVQRHADDLDLLPGHDQGFARHDLRYRSPAVARVVPRHLCPADLLDRTGTAEVQRRSNLAHLKPEVLLECLGQTALGLRLDQLYVYVPAVQIEPVGVVLIGAGAKVNLYRENVFITVVGQCHFIPPWCLRVMRLSSPQNRLCRCAVSAAHCRSAGRRNSTRSWSSRCRTYTRC